MAKEKWDFDLTHSSVTFWVRHLMVSKVHGRFAKWGGLIELDDVDPSTSRAQVRIEAASIDTQEAQRDGHLRSADFLDVERHPSIVFSSTSVERAGEGRYRLQGDLTIRGTTKPIALDVEYAGRVKDPWGGERAGFTARTSLDRKDFGLTWNQALDAGGVVVGDKVDINLEIEAIRAKS